MNSKPLVWLEGVSSVVFGVAAFSIFYVIVVWMPKYVMAFAGMSEAEALKTVWVRWSVSLSLLHY